MRDLVKRVENNQKQTQNLLDSIEKEDLLVDSRLVESMKRAEAIEDKQVVTMQVFEADRKPPKSKSSELEIVPEIKQGETFQMTTSIVSNKEDSELSLNEPKFTIGNLSEVAGCP